MICNSKSCKKSSVWELFGIIYDSSNVKLNYVACKICNKVYTFKTSTSTTTTLKHKCHFLDLELTAVKMFFKKHIVTKQPKKKMTAAVTIDELLANPTTVSHNVKSRAQNDHKKLILVLKNHFNLDLNKACTLDLWMDVIIVVSNSGLNCFGANDIPLVFEWLVCINHKSVTVLTTVVNKTIKIENAVKSKPFHRYKDVQHMLHLFMLIDALVYANRCEMYDELVPPPQMKDKLRKLNDIPGALLKQLINFLASFQLATLVFERYKHPTLHKWRHVIMNHLQLILNDVVDENGIVTTAEESDSIKDIMLPLLYRKFVLDDIQVMAEESDSIKAIKGIMLPLLYRKFVLDDIQVMASLLDRIMKFCLVGLGVDRNQIEQAKSKLKNAMMKYTLLKNKEEDVLTLQSHVRKKSLSLILMKGNEDDEKGNVFPAGGHYILAALNARVDKEYEVHMKHNVTDGKMKQGVETEISDEFHVLSWCRRKGKQMFPILARVVQSTLCIPASSAMSENNFLDAGNILTKKCNRLKPRTYIELRDCKAMSNTSYLELIVHFIRCRACCFPYQTINFIDKDFLIDSSSQHICSGQHEKSPWLQIEIQFGHLDPSHVHARSGTQRVTQLAESFGCRIQALGLGFNKLKRNLACSVLELSEKTVKFWWIYRMQLIAVSRFKHPSFLYTGPGWAATRTW
ncbi:LOW QUALITY PROTEIN: hypothetical protein MARPO_0131s0011 [Marchantia polymorpha]|uniref:BED-type domain-containing protein n=1 Tax=Marchantia polymorpha TaxID=3197 RepID=A0A2R6W828_MARPO|nr:LOW QUALITY PROTEIN: hypothetical protein MARPO_0131s0011 [Marchantia polymorpha]|eukprot:PTQ30010.1 LOW QUALITY PROTEIN: hypothetical protein MARPO_0131s0011 [Marchantia polymorpha]